MILKLASKNMIEIQKLNIGMKTIQIQGADALITMDKLNKNGTSIEQPHKILPFTNLVVNIIPGTAYSEMQLRQDMITLREVGVQIPDEIMLDVFKIGDTQEILLKMKMAAAQNSNPDIEMAAAENKKMLM